MQAGSWTLTSLIQYLTDLIGLVIPIAVAICVLAFLWGLFQILVNSGNAEKSKDAKTAMLWSVLALFVVLSLGGIVELLAATIGAY